jgi:hypothetical protein
VSTNSFRLIFPEAPEEKASAKTSPWTAEAVLVFALPSRLKLPVSKTAEAVAVTSEAGLYAQPPALATLLFHLIVIKLARTCASGR